MKTFGTACVALVLLAANLSADVADLVSKLDSDDGAESLKAARQLVGQAKPLPKTAVSAVVAFASHAGELKPPKQDSNLSAVPIVGDETALVRVKATPSDFVGKEFYLCGALSVSDYYNFRYLRAADSHYSLRWRPITKDAKIANGDSCTIYADRSIAGPLVAAITERQEHGADAMAVRTKVTLRPSSPDDLARGWDCLELLDWQFLTDDKQSWGPWAFERVALVKDLIRKLPDDASPIIAEAILDGKMGAAVRGALREHLLSMDKPARLVAARKAKQLAAKTKDKHDKAEALSLAEALDPKPAPKKRR